MRGEVYVDGKWWITYGVVDRRDTGATMIEGYQLPAELSDDERYRLLADRRRRVLLTVVTAYGETTDTVSLGELASDVDRRERDREDADWETRKDLLVRLHHVHLPVLDRAGVVDYDPATKRVVLQGPDVEAPLVTRETSYSD